MQQEVMLQPAGANKRGVQREATQQPGGALKGSGASRGCGATRSHGTTNQVNGRQWRIKSVYTSRGREAVKLLKTQQTAGQTRDIGV